MSSVFCFGHLIHTGLNLGQKVLYMTAENGDEFKGCTSVPDILMGILQPIYAFYNLFFVFKYSNVSKFFYYTVCHTYFFISYYILL